MALLSVSKVWVVPAAVAVLSLATDSQEGLLSPLMQQHFCFECVGHSSIVREDRQEGFCLCALENLRVSP